MVQALQFVVSVRVATVLVRVATLAVSLVKSIRVVAAPFVFTSKSFNLSSSSSLESPRTDRYSPFVLQPANGKLQRWVRP